MSGGSEHKPQLKLKVPKGFFNVLEIFLRDVLQARPNDVFEYGARYFENLLQVRTECGHDPSIHGQKAEFIIKDTPTAKPKAGKKRFSIWQ